jgi:hypothetical protein
MLQRTDPAELDTRMSRGDYVYLRDRWMELVLGKGWLPENYRIIGVRLALYANFDEQFARPAIERVAKDTATSTRTVIRAIDALEKAKLLRVERRKRGVNRYFLTF